MAAAHSSPGFPLIAKGGALSAGARAILAMGNLHDGAEEGEEYTQPPAEVTGNDVLSTAWRVSTLLEQDKASLADLQIVIRHLRDDAFLRRATRLHRYPGGTSSSVTEDRLKGVVRQVLDTAFGRTNNDSEGADAPSRTATEALACFRNELERTRYAAVFTAHPTFAVANEVYAALASYASAPEPQDVAPDMLSHRRKAPPTLEEEFTLASAAIDQHFKFCHISGETRFHHRRRHMSDGYGSQTPFGRRRFAGIVDDKRINHWNT